MKIKKLKELLNFFKESGLDELEVRGLFYSIKMVKRGSLKEEHRELVQEKRVEPEEKKKVTEKDNLIPVKSPMVGTFYRAPAPGAPPFVEVGEEVKAGQILCIIEAMKVMNEIEAERPGIVRKILVNDGEPVEYGQVLFLLEPLS